MNYFEKNFTKLFYLFLVIEEGKNVKISRIKSSRSISDCQFYDYLDMLRDAELIKTVRFYNEQGCPYKIYLTEKGKIMKENCEKLKDTMDDIAGKAEG